MNPLSISATTDVNRNMSDVPSELREYLLQARQGDNGARDRLFAVCRSYLGVLARANVQPWMQAKLDASDIVQQTLLDAHRDFGQFEGQTEQEWLAWLRQILAHNTGDAVRHFGQAEKRDVRREVPLNDAGSSAAVPNAREPASLEASPSQWAMHNERELLLAEAIERLDDDYREVILLRNIARLSFDEVADRMGRTRPAVQMLWMRAIKTLRASLKGIGLSTLGAGVP